MHEMIPVDVLEAIRLFFEAIDRLSFRSRFFQVLNAFSVADYYRYTDPADVLFLMDKLRDLLSSLEPWAQTLVIPEVAPISFPYLGSLNPGEAPEEVIARFFHLYKGDELVRWLEVIRYYALSSQRGADSGEEIDTLGFYHDVSRVVEASSQLHSRFNWNRQSNNP